MTGKECATELQQKSFKEIFALTEDFLTEMQQSGLFLAFCSDKKFFHVLGAHTEIIEIAFDEAEDNSNIHVFRDAEGGINFKEEKQMQAAEDGALIYLKWQVIGENAGFVLSTTIPYGQVALRGENNVCRGIVFSRADLK